MTNLRAPEGAHALVGDPSEAASWDLARDRLTSQSGTGHHSWIATVQPDGRPHLMPVLAFWFDGALHFVVGERTRKGRNLAANSYCVIGTESNELPSLDIVVEGRAEPVTDHEVVRTAAEHLGSNGWPLEAKGDEVFGPNAPTAGEPPYRIYRLTPTKAFGLPGTYGMEQFKQEELPKPTRWDF